MYLVDRIPHSPEAAMPFVEPGQYIHVVNESFQTRPVIIPGLGFEVCAQGTRRAFDWDSPEEGIMLTGVGENRRYAMRAAISFQEQGFYQMSYTFPGAKDDGVLACRMVLPTNPGVTLESVLEYSVKLLRIIEKTMLFVQDKGWFPTP